MKQFKVTLVIVCLGLLAGCGGSSSSTGGGKPPQVDLQSIDVAPATPSVAAGLSKQFTATGHYSDNSTKDLTSSATWTSSSTAVAKISASGNATGVAVGSTTITASASGVSGSTSLAVTPAVLSSITVLPATASIAPGTTKQFQATGTFSDGSSQDITSSVTWSSSNTSIANVNLNGVPGLSKGLATGNSSITATSGSVSSSAVLTVTNATLVSIAVTPATISIPLGTLQQFNATGSFSDGTTQDITGTVAWSSSSNSTVSITTGGLATGLNLTNVNPVTITASSVPPSGPVTGIASVTVNAANLSSISVTPTDPSVAQLTSEQFSATGTFTDGGTRDLTSQCTWSSTDTTIAKINGVGLAKALAPGSVTITATLGSVSGTTTLTVTNATVVSISVSPAGRTIAPGTKLALAATGTFTDGTSQNITSESTWASDNPAATVTQFGVVTGVAAGTANISATFETATGSTAVTVSSAQLVSIAVTPTTAVLAPASDLGYTAVGTYSDGTKQTISTAATWTSSDTDVATVTNFGLVTGQSAGMATITAQLGAVSGSADLVVEASPLVSVTVTPPSASVAKQTGVLFHARGTFGDGSKQDLTTSAAWTASPTSVASVSNSNGTIGLATGIAPGTATITALFAGQAGSANLTVTNATLQSLTISPSSADIPLGGSESFTAKGTFTDNTTEDLTIQVAWSSSDNNVATIAPSGIATSAATGTTTITATINGVTGTAVLTVH